MKWKRQYQRLGLLITAAMCICGGHALRHFLFDVPYRALVWDEKIWGRTLKDWSGWLSSFGDESVLYTISVVLGIVLLTAAISLIHPDFPKWKKRVLLFASFILFGITVLESKEQFFRIGQFMEGSIQWTLPFLLAYYSPFREKFLFALKLAVSLTFVGHGLYAFGIYPIPGHFLDMVLALFPLDEPQAILFLKVAGVLDFLVAVLIFIPGKWAKYALMYATVWGFLTALARLAVTIELGSEGEGLLWGLTQTVYRLGHGLVPLFLYHNLKKKRR